MTEEEEPPPPPLSQQREEEIKRLTASVRAIARTRDQTTSTQIESLDVEKRRLHNTELAERIELKKLYARRLLRGLGAQIAFVDLVFLGYAYWGVHWRIRAQVMDAWLGATVIEVIGVVLVVTKHLFPSQEA